MKRIKKILVGLIAMVMLVGASMSAFAADGAQITAISSIKDAANKSNITIYTNKIDGVIQTTDMTVTCATDKSSDTMNDSLKATSSNRGVVRVSITEQPKKADAAKGNKGTCTATLTLTPVANGKATVTVASISNPKKTKKITVTVKTLADEIAFSDNSPVEQNDGKYEVTLANKKGSKLNLGAYVKTPNASNVKLKYTVNSADKSIACDAKGNVSVKKENATGTIKIESADKENKMGISQIVNVKIDDTAVTTIKIAPDRLGKDKTTKSTKLADLGYGRVSSNGKQLYLKGNKGNANNTYQLNCVVDAKASMSDLVFSSNKPAVATVDANGKITAVGNGKATITVTPKKGNNAKATLNVTVDTDVEYVNVASTRFTILANNKDTAKINATTNGNATIKKVAYRVDSVSTKNGEGEYSVPVANNKDYKKYITVDGKGNVKAKQECRAKIVAEAKDSKKNVLASATITVTAEDSVTGLTLIAKANEGYGKDLDIKTNAKTGHPTKITAYRTGEADGGKLKLSTKPTWLSKATDKTLESKDVTWSSNKTAVAKVDGEGNVTLVGNGTAKITAQAKSGKSASTTITVKTDAYKITPAVQVTEEDGKAIIYVNEFTGKKTPASIINASVNADASNKKVSYTSSKAQITKEDIAGEGYSVKVATTKVDNSRADKIITADYVIKSRSASEADSRYTIVSDGQTIEKLELKAGETCTLKAMKDGAVQADATWGSTNTKSVKIDKNGVVKAMAETAPGTVAKITVGGAETIEVVVGRKDAAVQTEINKSFKTKLNEENRDYTGVSAKFNEKTRAVQMSILNPTQDIKDLGETGLVAAMEEIAFNSLANGLVFDEVVITDSSSKQYTVTRTRDSELSTSVELTDANGKTKEVDSLGTAVAAVLSSHGSRVQDLNGESYNIALKLHYIGALSLTYDLAYTADVSMSAANYDKLVDSKITNAVNNFTAQLDNGVNFNGETADSNIIGVKYNEAANEFDVTVEDLDVALEKFTKYSEEYANKSFDDLWAEAEQQKDNVSTDIVIDGEQKTDAKDIASDLSSVTIAFTSANGQRKVDTVERTDESMNAGESKKAFVKRVLSKYFEQLKADEDLDGVAGSLGNLVGSVASANVTFTVGKQTYTQSYKVNFLVSDKAYDKAADKRISEKVDENKAELANRGFEVYYYDDSNKLTVDIKERDLGLADWQSALNETLANLFELMDEDKVSNKLNSILDTMVGTEEDNVTKANVVVNGKTTVLVDGKKEYGADDAGKLLAALVEVDNAKAKTKATTLRDMDGRTATLKVTYDIGSKIGGESREVTLVYTIKFSVEGADKTKTSEALSVDEDKLVDDEEADDEIVQDETGEETEDESDETVEDETDGTTEDETDGTTEDETDGTTEDETDGTTEDGTDGTAESDADGAAESETATETPADTTAEEIEVINTVEE